jgi:hypothetical protein
MAGLGQQFVATGMYSDNHLETLQSVTWTSSAPSIATVSNDPSDPGEAFALAAGNTTVQACAGAICGSATLTVSAAVPLILRLTPSSGLAGTSVQIVGANFGGTKGSSTVTFNGVAVTTYGPWTNTAITVTVPNGAMSGNVVVTVNGVPSNALFFPINGIGIQPVIYKLSLSQGPEQMGFVITGADFGPPQGNSSVTLNGVNADVVSWSPNGNSITVDVPAHASSGNVIVTVFGVQSNGVPFTVTGGFSCTNQ